MVPCGACARDRVDLRVDAIARAQPAGLEPPFVPVDFGLDFLRVVDDERAARRNELAAIADLPARLRIERRAVEHDDGFLAREDLFRLRAAFVERDHFRIEGERVVTMEFGRAAAVVDALARAEARRGARALALALHGGFEAGVVDAHAALARDVGGQIDRKAERVVELEHGLAVEHLVFAVERAFEHFHAVLERLREALLFLLEDLRDALLRPSRARDTRRPSLSPAPERPCGRTAGSDRACNRGGSRGG